jgi:hypothetical protein
LRCNRQIPCDTCIRRKLQASCHYASNAKRNKASRQVSIDDRLQRLEELVSDSLSNTGIIHQPGDFLAEGGLTGASSADLQIPPKSTLNDQSLCLNVKSAPERESPYLHEQDGQVVYKEASHWMSIMQEIKDIRADLSSHDSLASENFETIHNVNIQPDINLDISLSHALSVTDAISSLPPQPTCDILLSSYFNSRYMVLGMN